MNPIFSTQSNAFFVGPTFLDVAEITWTVDNSVEFNIFFLEFYRFLPDVNATLSMYTVWSHLNKITLMSNALSSFDFGTARLYHRHFLFLLPSFLDFGTHKNIYIF